MAEMDQGIKRLIQTHPRDVLALALPEAEYLGTLPVDVATEPQLVLDTLLRARYQGHECAIDVEAEARPRPDIGERLYLYAARAKAVTGLSVISVVLYLERNGTPPDPPHVISVGDWQCGTWNFRPIALYDTAAESLLERGLHGLLPLVPFSRGGGNVATIERTAKLVREQASESEVGELEALLAVFGARFVGSNTMLTIIRRLGMSTEILETSPLYREWVQKAQEAGMQQGRLAGMRDSVRLVLEGRFSTLDEQLLALLNVADETALMWVLAHVATDSLEHIRARLAQPTA